MRTNPEYNNAVQEPGTESEQEHSDFDTDSDGDFKLPDSAPPQLC
jgi:hypothetical protein